jgi:hypothetical protein
MPENCPFHARTGPPQHRVTVPDHDPLRVGMLGAILKDVSRFTGASVERILELL